MHNYFEHEVPGDDQWLKLRSMIWVDFTPVTPDDYREPIKTWDDLCWWVYRLWALHISYWPYDIKYGIQNLYHWFRLIWSDRDWDQSFMWRLLLFKLKCMQAPLRQHVVPGPHQAALDRCVDLLEEIAKRDHCNCNKCCDWAGFSRCSQEQRHMLQEFGRLFAEYSPSWWD